ncbi:hypothetical protein BJX99DRAFT_87694 [Aspergillus californicus]
MDFPLEPSRNMARQVCRTCKIRKRRCNKALPKCSLCARKNLRCEYTRPEPAVLPSPSVSTAPAAAASASAVWWEHDSDTDTPVIQPVTLSTLLFLDPYLLQHGPLDLSVPSTLIPSQILDLLGNLVTIRSTAEKYFQHIHTWMPIISKTRFYDLYLTSSFRSKPDIVLLFLVQRLITSTPPSNPRTALYETTKHFYVEVEGSSNPSLQILQAGLLIALYELGQGIYPAAYLSIGACARYACLLGIEGNLGASGATQRQRIGSPMVLSMLEMEERRRVWWGIVILDRFVNISSPGRALATQNPSLNDYLPADDEDWENGIITPDNLHTLSTPTQTHMSKFALLCQAARILGQVLQHHATNIVNENTEDESENTRIQLDRTLQSMLSASLALANPDYDQITFVYSALVALYTPSLATVHAGTGTSSPQSAHAKSLIGQVTRRVSTNLVERGCLLGRDVEEMAPWGLYFAYRVCEFHLRFLRARKGGSAGEDDGDADGTGGEIEEVVRCLKDAFRMIQERWRVAGIYLGLLEAGEVLGYQVRKSV